MSEKRCENCESWKWSGVGSIGDTTTGDCKSESLNEAQSIHMRGCVRTRSCFGCIYWQQREPDLREQIAKCVASWWTHIQTGGEHYYASLGVADDIIAILEKYQKGKGNE